MSAPPPAPTLTPYRWRARVLLFVGAGALLAGAALAERSPVPLFLALPWILAPIAAGLYLSRRPLAARLSWTEHGEADRVVVEGRIETDPPVPAAQLYPSFPEPEPLRLDGPPRLSAEGGELGFTLEYTARRPCLADLPVPTVVWRDPLGLLEAPVRLEGAPLPVERYPPELDRLRVTRLHRTTPVAGEVRSRSRGASGEFFTVRPAVPSDTPRQINWRATARAGRWLSNDFLTDRTGDLLVLVDRRPSGLGEEVDAALLAIARAGAYGVALGFLRAKSRVGLGLFGEFLEAVPLATGRRQRHRLREALRTATVAEGAGPSERLGIAMRQYFPPGVTTLLVSPLANEEQRLLRAHLYRRGYPVLVLSPSPVPVQRPVGPGADREDRIGRRLLELDRARWIAESWAEGPTVDWSEYWSLAPLAALLRRPMPAGGGRG